MPRRTAAAFPKAEMTWPGVASRSEITPYSTHSPRFDVLVLMCWPSRVAAAPRFRGQVGSVFPQFQALPLRLTAISMALPSSPESRARVRAQQGRPPDRARRLREGRRPPLRILGALVRAVASRAWSGRLR
jgi:hypothetical protein